MTGLNHGVSTRRLTLDRPPSETRNRPFRRPRRIVKTDTLRGSTKREGAMKRILTVVAWAVVAIAAAAGAADAQTPQFTLSGLVVVEGGGRAWLQEPQLTQNQPVALRPGESIGQYRLTKIHEDRVEMMGPSGTIS